MSAVEPAEKKFKFLNRTFDSKEKRDLFASGFLAGLKATGGEPIDSDDTGR